MYKRGGGVCAFIKSSIGFTIIEELDNPLFECLWLYLRPPRLPRGFSCIIICIIYHPPLDDEAGLAEYLISSMDSVLDKNPNAGIFLVGDFNRFNFRILSNNFNLRQLVKAPTRGSATLDLILTNLFEHYSKRDILAGIGLSDHKSIFIRPLMHVKKRKAKVVYRRSVKPHMKDGFRMWLTSTDFTFLEALPSCPEKLNAFQSLLNYAIELFFPLRKSKQHPNDKPWITSELRSLIQQRQQAMDKDPETFRKLRNKVNRLNNRLRSSFFERKVKNCDDAGSWWKSIKQLSGISSKKSLLSVIEANIEINSIELATRINNKFLTTNNSLPPLPP